MKKLNIAIIGQGRSGRDIHGRYYKSDKNDRYIVKYVVELDSARRELALSEYPGCEVFDSYTALFDKTDIDLVVNASFSKDHYAITKDLLEHNYNVLVEKPFARSRYECDTLIKLANEKGVTLNVFQQSFMAPFYTHAQDTIKSGKLGEIKQVDITYSGFARRWDWQTAQVTMGGNIYNTGPHPIGIGLALLDFDKDTQLAFSRLGRVLNSGDSDDYAKLILTAPGKPVIDIEVNSNDAYSASTIKILGSRGTYKTTINEYEMKYIVDGENPHQTLILDPLKNAEGFPAYCKEDLISHEEEGVHNGTPFDVGTQLFYEMLYAKLTENRHMEILPEHAAMIINIIEQAHVENPLPIIY